MTVNSKMPDGVMFFQQIQTKYSSDTSESEIYRKESGQADQGIRTKILLLYNIYIYIMIYYDLRREKDHARSQYLVVKSVKFLFC